MDHVRWGFLLKLERAEVMRPPFCSYYDPIDYAIHLLRISANLVLLQLLPAATKALSFAPARFLIPLQTRWVSNHRGVGVGCRAEGDEKKDVGLCLSDEKREGGDDAGMTSQSEGRHLWTRRRKTNGDPFGDMS
ncbi:hypothetical protein CDAR_526931 [Caerostris darwini]|uniref:Uncharacterized protein n=1 Tax=Caerostris darwini TaxID=1538125 RepID=A0AAV4Q5J4_9ARAC|nr:hypothetical protein CDAR_526931 [Caerostris darwini]